MDNNVLRHSTGERTAGEATMPSREELDKHFHNEAKAAKDALTKAEVKLRDAQVDYNINGPTRSKMITEDVLADLRREAAAAKANAELWAKRDKAREDAQDKLDRQQQQQGKGG